MKNILFSVIIPVYNREPHIKRSIESVLNQTYSNFELILVDDNSTDKSVEEIKKFTDDRIKVLYRIESGPDGYAARNLGIEEAKGEWIAFLDANDEWMKDHLENYVKILEEFPQSHFLSSGYVVCEYNKEIIDIYYKENKNKGNHAINFAEYLKLSIQNKRPTNADVVCIKNTQNAKDIFPDGKASGGGDLQAWILYLAKEKTTLAWSSHTGAIYYRDSINMVIKTAKHSTFLSHYIIELFKNEIIKEELVLLGKYSNNRIFNTWKKLKQNNVKSNPCLPCELYWKNNIVNVLKMSLISLIICKILENIKQEH